MYVLYIHLHLNIFLPYWRNQNDISKKNLVDISYAHVFRELFSWI